MQGGHKPSICETHIHTQVSVKHKKAQGNKMRYACTLIIIKYKNGLFKENTLQMFNFINALFLCHVQIM